MAYKFSEGQIKSAAATASSKTEMMRLLGIKQGGGGYQALEKWCREYGVAPPIWDSSSALRQKPIMVAMPDEEWFVNGVFRQGQSTRKRMVASGIPDICNDCGLSNVWNGKPITLQVDHINGDRWDNRIENLRILCPNCHSQTETYSNTGRRKSRNYCDCGKEISKQSVRCVSCSNTRKNKDSIDWPDVGKVVETVRLTNFTRAGKIYGCTDNTIRKFLRRNGIDPKSIK